MLRKTVQIKRTLSVILALAFIVSFANLPGLGIFASALEAKTPKTNTFIPVNFVNGNFTSPTISDAQNFSDISVPGWYIEKEDPSSSSPQITLRPLGSGTGNYVSLGLSPDTLIQKFNTSPGQKIYYEFYHRGASGTDSMNFYLYGDGNTNITPIQTCTSGIYEWTRYSGVYTVPQGQTKTVAAFRSVTSAGGISGPGNYLYNIHFTTSSFLNIEKTLTGSSVSDTVYPSDLVTASLKISNTGENASSQTVLTDYIPDGSTLVNGSVRVNGVASGLFSYDTKDNSLKINIGTNATTGSSPKNGGSISAGGSVTVTYDICPQIAETTRTVNTQAKVTHNNLGFESFEATDFENYSPVATIKLSASNSALKSLMSKSMSTMSSLLSEGNMTPETSKTLSVFSLFSSLTLDSGTNATLSASKFAQKMSGDTGHTISVQIEGTKKQIIDTEAKPMDIVLVLDVTESMSSVANGGSTTKWLELVSATNNLVDYLLPDGSQNRIAIVIFAENNIVGTTEYMGYRAITNGFEGASARNSIKSKYNTSTPSQLAGASDHPISANGTGIQYGFIGAYKLMLQARTDAGIKNHVIMLTDGVPNRYLGSPTGRDNVLNAPVVTSTTARQFSQIDYSASGAENASVEWAGYVKSRFTNATVHCVGFGLDSNSDSLLKRMASSDNNVYRPQGGQLDDAFKNLVNSITVSSEVEQTNVKLEDPMSQYVDYSGDLKFYSAPKSTGNWTQIYPASGDYTVPSAGNGWTLNWTVANYSSQNIYKVSYNVKVKTDYEGKQLHKSNTRASSNTAGTDGVYANGPTYISSNLCNRAEILVPAIYQPIAPKLNAIKSAVVLPNAEDGHNISIQIDGTKKEIYNTIQTPLDIVLVLDVTNSMTSTTSSGKTRWTELIESTNSLIDYLIPDGSPNRIAIVIYGQCHKDSQYYYLGSRMLTNGFEGSASREAMKGLYNRPSPSALALDSTDQPFNSEGTGIQYGLITAYKVMKSARSDTIAKKHIILLTDGEPNRALQTPVGKDAILAAPPKQPLATNTYSQHGTLEAGRQYALEWANYLKQDYSTTTLHTIGFTLDSTSQSLLVNMASNPKNAYQPQGGELQQVFMNLAYSITEKDTVEQKSVTIIDPMSQYVDYKSNLHFWKSEKGSNNWVEIFPAANTYQIPAVTNNWTLKWTISDFTAANSYKVTYDVRVKEEYEGIKIHQTNTLASSNTPGTDGVYANKETLISSDCVPQQEIPVPAIFQDYSLVSFKIQKIIDKTSKYPEQFIFKIEHRKEAGTPITNTYYSIVTVPVNATTNTVLLYKVKAGYITITEEQTNWRYEVLTPSNGTVSQLIRDPKNIPTFTFTNKYKTDQWISGKVSVTNHLRDPQ